MSKALFKKEKANEENFAYVEEPNNETFDYVGEFYDEEITVNEENSYGEFAYIYDELMDNVPYDKWLDIVCRIIEKYGVSKHRCDNSDALTSERNLCLDLGCGTGTFTKLMYDKGYDMIGIDSSQQMLEVAMDKKYESGDDILYLNQDMRSFELYCTVGTVISICDAVNYILKEEELLSCFKLVNNYLFPGGIFIFDFNTLHKYRDVIGDTTIAENREDCSFIWENSFDEETCINQYNVTFFEEVSDGLFRRFSETHLQRGYRVEEILNLVKKAGLEVVLTLDADTQEDVNDNSERVYIVAKECTKKK